MHVVTATQIRRCFGLAVLALVVSVEPAIGQELAQSLKSGDQLVSMPSAARVIGGFVVTVGLAIGVVYCLKRLLPLWSKRLASIPDSSLTVKTALRDGVRYHIVAIGEHTVLVAEGKTGVAMTVLPGAFGQATESPLGGPTKEPTP